MSTVATLRTLQPLFRIRRNALPELGDITPRVAPEMIKTVTQIGDSEVIGADCVREFLPFERRRNGGLRQGAGRIGADRRRATVIAKEIDEDSSAARAL